MSDLADIIARLEKATGPDRKLDFDIREAIGTETVEVYGAGLRAWAAPEYTSSIDAALTLVPNGWEWALFYEAGKYRCEAGDPLIGLCSEAPIPAIAICIAALQARQAASLNLAHREQQGERT